MQVINIRNLILKQLLFQLNEQYENNTFQINTSLRHATETILEHQPDLHVHMDEKEVQNVRMEVNMFMFALIKAPSTWVQMLRNDKISSRTARIPINTSETLTEVYKEIVFETNQLVNQNYAKNKDAVQGERKQLNFQKEYIDEATKSMLAYLLNSLAQQICKFLRQGKKIILKEQRQIEQELAKSEIMNPYFLFGILKQMGSRTYTKIEEEMSTYFKNLPAETITKFCRYVQKNYEYVELICSESLVKIYTDQQMRQSIDLQNEYWLSFLKGLDDNKLIVKKLTSDKGDSAVMIIPSKQQNQNQQSFNDAEKLIMKIGKNNQIYVTNLQASQKKWEILSMKDTVSGLYRLMKNAIATQNGSIDKQIITYGVPIGQYLSFGRSLGKTIANINRYKNANQFFKDLSRSAIIGGSMSYIFRQAPIMTYFAIVGGLTYTFYHIFKNRATSKTKKVTQIGKTTLTAVSAFGSGMAGTLLGQSLIPIPFVGAFVGGVIGGFLGQTGATLMTKLMNKESYRNLINYLGDEFIDDERWSYSQQMLGNLGIGAKYFNSEICLNQTKRDTYITAICFCIVSSYESKRYIQRNKQKMKELEQKKKEVKNDIQLFEEEQSFQNQFNIVRIVDYLTANNFNLKQQHEKLSKSIRHISI